MRQDTFLTEKVGTAKKNTKQNKNHPTEKKPKTSCTPATFLWKPVRGQEKLIVVRR